MYMHVYLVCHVYLVYMLFISVASIALIINARTRMGTSLKVEMNKLQ